MMPKQLQEGLERFRKLKLKPRPIAELLPHININDFKTPKDDRIYILPNIGLRYPFLASARLSWDCIEFNYPALHRGKPGRSQTFPIKPIRTGFGIRHAFVCCCGRGATKLYYCNSYLACKRCHRVRYGCQAVNSRHRPVLQASRIQSILDNAKLYNRTRDRLTKRLGQKVMMHQSLWK